MSDRSICEKPVSIAIATRNPMKMRATEKAFSRFCNVSSIITVEPPDVPRQPCGTLEVLKGALMRAQTAFEHGDFGIGIEAGPIEFYTTSGYIETQVAIIVGPGERVSIGMSPSFELPYKIISRMLDGVELGELTPVKRVGDRGEGIGYIGVVTRGHITRQDLTELAITMALVPWIGEFHRELQTLSELKRTLSGV